ncbi:unnamed protein product, partial [Mesorhabditis spiculigera]
MEFLLLSNLKIPLEAHNTQDCEFYGYNPASKNPGRHASFSCNEIYIEILLPFSTSQTRLRHCLPSHNCTYLEVESSNDPITLRIPIFDKPIYNRFTTALSLWQNTILIRHRNVSCPIPLCSTKISCTFCSRYGQQLYHCTHTIAISSLTISLGLTLAIICYLLKKTIFPTTSLFALWQNIRTRFARTAPITSSLPLATGIPPPDPPNSPPTTLDTTSNPRSRRPRHRKRLRRTHDDQSTHSTPLPSDIPNQATAANAPDPPHHHTAPPQLRYQKKPLPVKKPISSKAILLAIFAMLTNIRSDPSVASLC